MENLLTKYIRRWVYLMAIFSGFSLQTGLSHDLTGTDASATSRPRGMDPVIFSFGCIDGEPGDTICIPVTVENFTSIVIAQFEITWNSDVLDYIEITNPGTPSINVTADFNLSGPNALKFIPLGFPISGETLADGAVLFEICFRVIGIPGSTSCVGISPFFDFEVADVSGVIPGDSVNCCMMVENAVNLVGFVTSCGPAMAGGNGSIDVTAYGGMAPYTITWVETVSGIPGGPVIIPVEGGANSLSVPAGNYDVTLTDALGNSVVYNTIVSDVQLTVATTLKDPTCYKFSNGTIRIKPLGGMAPFSYIWQSLSIPTLAGSGFIRNPGDSSLVTSLPDGMYRILVEDLNGCEAEIIVTLNDNPFVINIDNLINATCPGSEDGVISLSVSGATPDIDGNYTIIVRPGFQVSSNMVSIGLLDPGTYTITISDEVSQCDTIYEFTIGYQDTITANITVNDPPCAGQNNGSVSIRGLTNGVPGASYSYSIYEGGVWITTQNNIGGTFNYSPLGAGDYVAIVMEGSCTSDSIHFTITEPEPIIVSVDGSTPDNCIPTASGDIWFTIMNGTPPYELDAGAGSQDGDTLFNLNAGNYVLTVTDDMGCTATLPFVMNDGDDNEEADISFVFDGIPCEGGTVTVLYQGEPIPPGVGVSWSSGEITPTITITGTDILGVDVFLGAPVFCILQDTVHVECIEKLRLDITVTQPLCGEGAEGGPYTGTVIVDTSNATAPVTWYWSFPDTTTTGIYTGLAPGTYYVTVTDGLDSVAVDTFEIIAPNTINFGFSNIIGTSCPETCDGSVTVTPLDGDPALDYFLYWDPVNPMADTGFFFNIPDLCAGMHAFTVSQDGICFYKDTVEITAPDSIQIDLVQAVDVSCFGGDDGSIEVMATGGTPGYSYMWPGSVNLPLYSNIPAGGYEVTVTDNNGCVQAEFFTVEQPDSLIADIDSSATLNLSCGGSNDGVIIVEVSGGNTGGYTFTWNPDVSGTYQAANLDAGTYSITVSDPKGCSDTTSYTLSAPPPIVVDWPVVVAPACFGDETVILVEDVSGGSGNYSYNINGGELFEIGEPVMVPAGIYIVSVFDDRGCSSDTTYMIIEPNPILVSIGPDEPVIDLGDSIFIIGNVDQSDNPIEMMFWSSVQPMSCDTCQGTWVFNNVPTTYTWTVTDINGCQGSASILVHVDYDRDIYIPNVFSPNGDGRNDDFRIYTGLGVVSINYLRIFDRWGNLLHEEGPLMPNASGAGNWDGTSNGDEVNPGVYVYVAEITFIDNNTTLTYKGDITLIK